MEKLSLEGQLVALQGIVTLLVQRSIRTDAEMVRARELVASAIESYYERRTINEDRHAALQIALSFVEEMLAPDASLPKDDRE